VKVEYQKTNEPVLSFIEHAEEKIKRNSFHTIPFVDTT
jgi:hypothetical protein